MCSILGRASVENGSTQCLGIFGSDDIIALETAALDMIAETRLIEKNLPGSLEVHARKGHPFRWLVTVYGEQLGLGSRSYDLVDVFPVVKVERAEAVYIAAH